MISDSSCLAYALRALPYLNSPCIVSTWNFDSTMLKTLRVRYVASAGQIMLRYDGTYAIMYSVGLNTVHSLCLTMGQVIIDIISSSVKKHVY